MKIFAIGLNYPQHNKELNETLYKGESPVIFTKADSSLLKDGKPFFVPDDMGRIDYETEIVYVYADWEKLYLHASPTDTMMP